MPKIKTIQTNFTAGEISPKCYGRVDVNRYQNGAESLENCIVDIQGGANRRSGTKFIAATKDSTRRSILVPFVFSTTQAYMLELGHNYLRVYVASGGQVLVAGVPFEIATPWTEAMLPSLDYTQGADTMFLFHPDVPTQTLKRLASDNWVLQPAPWTVQPFDEVGDRFNTTLTLSAATVGAGRTFTVGASAFMPADVGRRITGPGSGQATITGYTSGTVVTADITETFGSTLLAANDWILQDSPQADNDPSAKDPVGAAITMTLTAAGWRAQDVGKFVEINGGLVLVTGITSDTIANGVIKKELTSDVAAPANGWILQASVWSSFDGYPRTGAFYEQRLVTAGSRRFPQATWGSRNGLYYDFTQGTDDDEGFTFELPSTGQINPIQRLVGATVLLPLTFGGEFTMHGGVEKPLTPTNVQMKGRSVFGCNTVKPVRVGGEILFVQRANRKIRALSYDADTLQYNAPDLTVLADHITKSGIVSMAYQQEPASQQNELQEPASLLWCVRADGKIATLTLDRDEGVIAWAPQSTPGMFESVACVPRPDGGDETWVIVQRSANGTLQRYVERFEDGYMMDSAIRGTSGGGSATWGGLSHLNGNTVWCLADGIFVGDFVVSGGSITIPRNAFAVEIGLPLVSQVKLLRPEVQMGDGTAQSSMISTSRVLPLIRDTTGCRVDTGDGFPQDIAFRTFGDELLDRPPEIHSGYESVGTLGWHQSDSPLTLIQDRPYPFHLLAVVREITFNS
ncbi:hypothetical protein [Cupriavidus oxalaticus]|uniref:hypothetical protein n=1 Tax=Cupriavidus oxalaticus TaxID=96344 RepID=UPI003170C073